MSASQSEKASLSRLGQRVRPICCRNTLLLLCAAQIFKAAGALEKFGGVAYVGPVFALCGVALQYGAAYVALPGEINKMLTNCKDLLSDLVNIWAYLEQEPTARQAMDGWIKELCGVVQTYVTIRGRRAGGFPASIIG